MIGGSKVEGTLNSGYAILRQCLARLIHDLELVLIITRTFFRLFWNRMTILLSVAINALMLFTWDARATITGVPKNATAIPPQVYE